MAAAIVAFAFTTQAHGLARSARPVLSLCTAKEETLFTCPIAHKLVSVCGAGAGAAYRYGRRGRVELEGRGVTIADRGFSGGGETQLAFERNGYRYVVYETTQRTAFGPDGRHDPETRTGLLIKRDGRTLSDRSCNGGGSDGVRSDSASYSRPGPFAEH